MHEYEFENTPLPGGDRPGTCVGAGVGPLLRPLPRRGGCEMRRQQLVYSMQYAVYSIQ